LSEAGETLSFAGLFVRDFRSLEDDEMGAARERIRALDQVPFFVLLAHLVAAAAIVYDLGSGIPPLVAVPLCQMIGLDLFAWLWFRKRKVSSLVPHVATRGAAAYVILANMLWGAVAWAAPGAASDPLVLDIALVGGIIALPVAFLTFPGLTLLGCLGCGLKIFLLSRDPQAGVVAASLSVCLIWLSLKRTCDQAALLKRRMEVHWNARRAARFIEEFEQSGRGWFWETSGRGALSYVSEHLAAHFKTSADDLIGRPFTELIGTDDRADTDASERTLGFHLSARLPFTDITVPANTSAEIWWSLSGTPSFDEHGRFLGFRGIGTDLTQQRRSEDEINRLAKYDSLTGLPNRALMRRTLDEALQNQKPTTAGGCALFLIDLDRFKNVNDTLGHPIGDALLKQVAQRLTNVIGEKGQIGRLGGDEFEAVLPTLSDASSLAALAERLIQQVSMPYSIEGHNISIGASVGIAIAPAEGCCADALIRNADLALYSAKAAGRGTFCFFAPEMHSEAQDRQILENDLRKAIGRGELQLVYQPVVNAQTEALSGFEALVRWHHASRGVISPTLFIPLAEESGLIPQIGEWVLRTACTEASKWPEHIRIAVNLSPIQFVDPNLPAIVMSALANSQIQPRQLELEITEGVFLVESESTDDMFAKLKQLGVRLALDDFGTGYSSLGYLKKAPFDKIKIDQSFVRGAASASATNRNAAIIRAIVTLADTLGMDTCAEGVETHDDLQLIRELGVSMVQGYIFGRPSPSETARELANSVTVAADGFACGREPRHRLMRRAVTCIDGQTIEVKLRNISSMGAQVECNLPVAPGAELAIDIVGVGPVRGVVRWAQSGKFGVQFTGEFDLARLAPKKAPDSRIRMLKPTFLDQREAS
jgi:diguanylate cyclase (GGDEF)-like protein